MFSSVPNKHFGAGSADTEKLVGFYTFRLVRFHSITSIDHEITKNDSLTKDMERNTTVFYFYSKEYYEFHGCKHVIPGGFLGWLCETRIPSWLSKAQFSSPSLRPEKLFGLCVFHNWLP